VDLKENLIKAISKAKEVSKKRNFVQSMDLVMNFKGVDFSKPNNRINISVKLPKGRGKQVKTLFFAGDETIVEAKKIADKVIPKEEIGSIDKKNAGKLANEYDVFFAQADLMPIVAKQMGQVLGPRGKMPKPVPANAKLEPIIKSAEGMITLKTKGKFLPTLHAVIGTEEMNDEDLTANANAVINYVIEKLPNKEGNLKSIYVKTSMGKSVKVEIQKNAKVKKE